MKVSFVVGQFRGGGIAQTRQAVKMKGALVLAQHLDRGIA